MLSTPADRPESAARRSGADIALAHTMWKAYGRGIDRAARHVGAAEVAKAVAAAVDVVPQPPLPHDVRRLSLSAIVTPSLVLHAQRSAGNAAVARAVAGGPRRTLARSLVGFAVQARVGDKTVGDTVTPVVAGLDIGGRPHGLFGAAHRSHVTAWVAFVDVVRNAVLYQPLPIAIQQLVQLVDEAAVLPGAAQDRLDAMEHDIQVSRPPKSARQIYDEAKNDALRARATAIAALAPARSSFAVAAVQDLAAAYLTLRNSIPLSVAHDVTVAGGHGEGASRAELQAEQEEDETKAELEAARGDPARLRRAFWKLLDVGAANFIATYTVPAGVRGKSPAPGTVPGEEPGRRIADIVAQHLMTLRRAYPTLYERSRIDEEQNLRELLGSGADLDIGGGVTVIARVRAHLGLPSAPMPEGSRQGVAGVGSTQRGAVQISVADHGGVPVVGDILVGSRPTGILGNLEGAHVTAFALAVEGLRTCLMNAPLSEVTERVEQMLTKASQLPTARRAADLDLEAKDYHEHAVAEAREALAAARATPVTDVRYVALLQRLLAAYLRYRNTLPLAATLEGGVPGGKAEGTAFERLRNAERALTPDVEVLPDADQGGTKRPSTDTTSQRRLLNAIWALIDSAAVRDVMGTGSISMAPGIRRPTTDGEMLMRVGDMVETHMRSIELAYPRSAVHAQMRSGASILGFLGGDLPTPGESDAALARQEGALALPGEDARRVLEYMTSGLLPPPPARSEAREGRRSRRASAANPRWRRAFLALDEADEEEVRESRRKRARAGEQPAPSTS